MLYIHIHTHAKERTVQITCYTLGYACRRQKWSTLKKKFLVTLASLWELANNAGKRVLQHARRPRLDSNNVTVTKTEAYTLQHWGCNTGSLPCVFCSSMRRWATPRLKASSTAFAWNRTKPFELRSEWQQLWQSGCLCDSRVLWPSRNSRFSFACKQRLLFNQRYIWDRVDIGYYDWVGATILGTVTLAYKQRLLFNDAFRTLPLSYLAYKNAILMQLHTNLAQCAATLSIFTSALLKSLAITLHNDKAQCSATLSVLQASYWWMFASTLAHKLGPMEATM